MCKIRALRHQCGHVRLRYLSYCRGTYSSPNTKAPLCSAGPSLTVAVDEKCQNCQYAKFCKSWEARIARAEAKQLVSRQLSAEFQEDEGCSELDGASGDFVGSGTLSWGDSKTALNAESNATHELEQLRKQFRQEQYAHWNSYAKSTWNGQKTGPSRKRRSSPKNTGDSPLKHAVELEDLPEQAASDEDLPSLEPSTSNDSECDQSSDIASEYTYDESWSAADYSWTESDLDPAKWPKLFDDKDSLVSKLDEDDDEQLLPTF